MSPLYNPTTSGVSAAEAFAANNYDSPARAYGMLAWFGHPDAWLTNFAYPAGRMLCYRVDVPVDTTFSSMSMWFNATGTSTTDGYFGLLDSGGNRIAVSASQGTNFNTGTGIRTISFATPVLVSGSTTQHVYAVYLSVGGTSPAIGLHSVNNAVFGFNQAPGSQRAIYLVGQSTIPTTNTLSGFTLSDHFAIGGLA